MRTKRNVLICTSILPFIFSFSDAFDVGIKSVACSLSGNNPCASLYDAICDGKHCKCGTGTREDKALKRCVKGTSSSGTRKSGDDFSDLPFDYNPNKNKDSKTPSNPTNNRDSTSRNEAGGAFPARPPYPNQPAAGHPPPQRPQDPYPKQPSGGYPHSPSYPNQPNYPRQPAYPNQPAYPKQPAYPNQPTYPNQPGRYPNQPSSGYPQQPGSYPGQPNQPGYPGPHRPHDRSGSRGGSNVGEKAGGGVGGVVGLLIIVGLVYFCCCRGGKGKNFMSKLPFGNRGNAGGQMQMQPAPAGQGPQQMYMPTDQPYPQQQYPGQQPVAPPPYSPTYQPTAPNPNVC